MDQAASANRATVRRIMFGALCFILSACSPAQRQHTGPHSRPESLLSAEARRTTPQVTPLWLVGYWDHRPTCPPDDSGTALWPDGTYGMADGSGTWSLSGDRLRIIEKRPTSVKIFQMRLGDTPGAKLTKIGPNTIIAEFIGAGGGLFYRCEPL